MPAQRTSHAAKIRRLNSQADKLARQLSRVQAQIEVQEAAATARLEREIARVERQCGVSSAKKTSKKAAKKAVKKAAKKAAKKAVKKAVKKAAKKAVKKVAKKKAAKKRAMVRGFSIDLFESTRDREPAWTGPLAEYLADNEEEIDDRTLARLRKLKPGASLVVDLGAGGRSKVRRRK